MRTLHSSFARALGRCRRCRVPVLLQMTMSECGLACLAMVVRFHGRRTGLTECRERVTVGRDGVSARRLAEAARSFGLTVRAYSASPASIEHLPLPAIAHWAADHFVVIERVSTKGAVIIDPAIGRRSISRQEFSDGLSGVVLTLTPNAGFRRMPENPERLDRTAGGPLRDPLMRSRRSLVTVLGASLLIQLLALALPLATVVLIDRVLPSRERDLLTIVASGIVVLVLTQFAVNLVRSLLLIRLQARLDRDIVSGLFGRLLTLPLSFFLHRGSGDLMQRLASTIIIRELITTQSLTAVLDGAFLVVYLGILLSKDMLFGVMALGIGFVQVLLVVATHTRNLRLHQRRLLAQGESESVLIETLNGIATIKATGAEARVFQAWSKRLEAALAIDVERNRLAALVENATGSIRLLAPLLLLWVGTTRVLDGDLSLGTMLALQALGVMFLAPLASLVANAQTLQSVGAHLERLRDVFLAEPEKSRTGTDGSKRFSGRIELRDVSFRYDPDSPPVLDHVSLVIEPGQTVAVVGRSGSGKSTLAMLLLGLYAPTSGDILYDDVSLRAIDLRHLRRQFGVVLQEPFVFRESIRRNISAGDESMPFEQVVAAAKTAEIHDDIVAMPRGYETRVGQHGSGLSGGQRQRLSIARAVAHRPAVLLLDEATSHLDAVTERRVTANLDALRYTRIVIAHRLSTILTADQIVVVNDGQIVERGSHHELLARDGRYASLVAGQHSEERLGPLASAA